MSRCVFLIRYWTAWILLTMGYKALPPGTYKTEFLILRDMYNKHVVDVTNGEDHKRNA